MKPNVVKRNLQKANMKTYAISRFLSLYFYVLFLRSKYLSHEYQLTLQIFRFYLKLVNSLTV